MTKYRLPMLGALIAVAIGSAMDWATADAGIFHVSKAGTDGDGIITLLIAVLAAVLLFVPSYSILYFEIAAATAILGVAVYDIFDVLGTSARHTAIFTVKVHVGLGLWVVAVAACVALGICAAEWTATRNEEIANV